MYPSDALRSALTDVLDPAPRHSPPPGDRVAAVLIPLLISTPQPRVVFTERSDQLSRHAGEISFPGGIVDAGESLAAAALREAEEELGLKAEDVELLGALTPVHTHVSGILVVPFVGLLAADPRFTPNAGEIAEVLEFPLADLVAAGEIREFEREGRRFRTFVFDMDGKLIWGVTGYILRNLLDVLAERLPDETKEDAR
ncbi:MAG TPA: CoA pyrophosphatase [Actinobacteria bacterium]|nr:CoA pyrophosphatase [Actinomycetota bacterium]